MSRTQNIWRYIYLMSIYLFTGGVAIGSSKLCSECETSRKPADSERRVRFLLHDSHPPTTMPTTDVTTTHQPGTETGRPGSPRMQRKRSRHRPHPSPSATAVRQAAGERPSFLVAYRWARGLVERLTQSRATTEKAGPHALGLRSRNLTAEIHLLLSLTRGAGFRGPPSLSVGAHGGLGRVNGTEKGRRAGGSRAPERPSRTGAKPAGSFEPTTAVQ
jgi:hypothetical protein